METNMDQTAADEVDVPPPLPPKPFKLKRRAGFAKDSAIAKAITEQVLPKVFQLSSNIENGLTNVWEAWEFVQEAYNEKVQRLGTLDLTGILSTCLGLLLLFFGERFIVTFTIIEAFKHGGSDSAVENLGHLKDQLNAIRLANQADNLVDEDGNGIPDVQELESHHALARRKVRVAVKAINPNVIQNAMQGLWTSLVSASAAVKVDAARSVALGISFGNDIDRVAQRSLLPAFYEIADETSYRWFPTMITYICRLWGILVAFALHSSMPILVTTVRGAFLFVSGAEICFAALGGSGYTIAESVKRYDLQLVLLLVCLGISVQALGHEGEMPPALKAILFPVLLLEHAAAALVTALKSDAEKFQTAVGNRGVPFA